MADKRKPAHERMYSGSPRIESDENGKKVIKKGPAENVSTTEEATNVPAGHDPAMVDLAQKHAKEMLEMSHSHAKAYLDMAKKASTVGGVENKE